MDVAWIAVLKSRQTEFLLQTWRSCCCSSTTMTLVKAQKTTLSIFTCKGIILIQQLTSYHCPFPYFLHTHAHLHTHTHTHSVSLCVSVCVCVCVHVLFVC